MAAVFAPSNNAATAAVYGNEVTKQQLQVGWTQTAGAITRMVHVCVCSLECIRLHGAMHMVRKLISHPWCSSFEFCSCCPCHG